MGVEPTKDRLAAPPGFEVRTPHRGRFSSQIFRAWPCRARRRAEQIKPMLVDAPQVAAPQGDAVAIKKFENLDGDLATVLDLIAELRGGELAMRRRQVLNDPDHFGHGGTQEKMVVSHFIELAHAAKKLGDTADIRFRRAQLPGNVAHPRRTKPLSAFQQRLEARP